MKDVIEILKFIEENPDETLILCTLVRKSGSSYRHLGTKKVVGPTASVGLLSGGCLEASIEKSARERQDEMPFIESFSTLAEEDRLMGYQTGCQGVIDILFEKIPVAGFDTDVRHWQEQLDLLIPFGTKRPAWGVAVTLSGPALGQRKFISAPPPAGSASDSRTEIFYEEWVQPLHLVVIGCGPDADAYVPLVQTMGWTMEFMDYRRTFVETKKFPQVPARVVATDKMAEHIPQGDRVAVLLMTHNYEADLEIMRGLRFHHLGYLGCLGPAKRYERLKKDMLDMHGEFISEHLQSVVSAPMGIFTNSNSPEAIALATVAQIQDKLIERPKDHVWSVVLAAGASQRFGSAKALAPWDGGTLLSRAISSCQEVTASATLVVTGGYQDQVTAKIPHGVGHSYNPAWEQGMGTSIAWAVTAVLGRDPAAKFIVLLPVDQPFADSFHLKKLIQESQKTGRCVLTEGQGFMGPPAVIPQGLFEKALALKGDQGLKKVLGAADIAAVKNEVAAQDFDSPEELKSARL